MFVVSIAFGAALLELTGGESGGFHLIGDSTLGKTTAAHVAGSVWGGNGDSINGYLVQWRATANGLEGVASRHCDALLALDEISEVSPREAASIAYMLANGSGKTRARRDGSARAPFEWRILFLSTGEATLSDKIREDPRQRATAGQAVRVLDIPAEVGPLGLFEDLHGAANAQTFADQLRASSKRFYGTAIRAFLTEVAGRRSEVADTVRHYQQEFLREHVAAGAHPQVSRAIARFSLVAAAGELASALGITGWPEEAAGEAVATALTDYLATRGHIGAAEVESGIAQVRRFFQLHGDSRFMAGEFADADAQTRTVLNRAGFRLSDGAFAVYQEVFKNEVSAGHNPRLLASALAARGLLRKDGGRPTYVAKDPGTLKSIRVFCIESGILGDEN